MPDVSAAVCCVGIGGWYPRGVARLIDTMARTNDGVPVIAWVNSYPDQLLPHEQFVVSGYDYNPYAAKPQALLEVMDRGIYDVVILVDAAFYPVRHLRPLINHIYDTGYYLCDNGNQVGEWSSDASLKEFGITREQAMGIREVSSYCVGVRTNDLGWAIAAGWTRWMTSFVLCAPHTSLSQPFGRNRGFVSDDPRVKGHRHDQTALAIIAHNMGLNKLVQRPKFTAYKGSETAETVLVNQGGL